VITKVHAQTERGLRQYLKRALRDGCTPAEVLDAMLMAFPALGLAKIVWAVDIILAMDLPEFRAAGLGAEAREPAWHDLVAVTELELGATVRIDRDGRGLFVHHGADGWRVFDSLCPHETTNIPHLALKGSTLTCPKHEWVFDVSNGACIAKGDRPLKRWEAKVDGGRVLARW
jgi:nitrite reductase/ring-hydroxylating ferredoxin subunit